MAQKSAPKGFSKGLITDVDPRYQLEGSYRDAMNVKLVNSDGTTFTIENINGNRLTLDLQEIDKTLPASYSGDGTQVSGVPQQYFQNVGGIPFGPDGLPMEQAANIVGHFSFRNELVIIVCGYIFYGETRGSQARGDFRTAFFKINFNAEGEVETVTDLRVAYIHDDGNRYPNLDMSPLIKCRVEGIIENDSISRIYWTDNKNPLRTFSLNNPDIHDMDAGELDITPKATHNQITLKSTISGSLPVGVYQYCYKYTTDSGAETGISPLSNIYHISNTNSATSATYFGGTPGALSNDGFLLKVTNLDTRYDDILIYAIYYNALNGSPQVSEVGEKTINADGVVEFRHSSLLSVIENGIENILIPTNTWDVCKDIAIKDNVLFAANLRQKKNFITEKEWNVKVKRYKISEVAAADSNNFEGGSLTTADSNVIDYTHPIFTDPNDYDIDSVVAVNSTTSYFTPSYRGSQQHSAYRYLPTKGNCVWGNGKFLPIKDATGNFRNILGGASHGYYASANAETNGLGGCMFSFRQIPKVSDTQANRNGVNDGSTPFISTNIPNDSLQTDNLATASGSNDNVDTEYTASFTVGSNKDAHASGNKRGYQRGETYRFGVLVYDLNGDPGNVLWIGDIKMPEHFDKAWELDLENTQLGRDARGGDIGLTKWKENPYAQDYRISAHNDMPVPGHGVQYDSTSFDTGLTTEELSDTKYEFSTEKNNIAPQMYPFCADGSSGHHYTMDLAVDFTFKIPPHVRRKISGFRVVRAERTETDRTIVQSGLINQICNYGWHDDIEKGYVSDDQNGKIGAAKVQAGDTASIIAENVDEVYDNVLNGYCGINAGSNSVVAKDSNNKPRYLNESESNHGLHLNRYGASSGEFGSYDRSYFKTSSESNEAITHVHSQVRAGLMYSPDSSFGIRPYSFSGEDKLQIVSTLKLYNEERTNNSDLQNYGTLIAPSSSHGYDTWNALDSFNSSVSDNSTSMLAGTHPSSVYQSLGDADGNRDQGLIFSTKKTTKDDESGVMVGKLAVLDTYFNSYLQNYNGYSNAGFSTATNHQYVNKDGINIYANSIIATEQTNYSETGAAVSSSKNPYDGYIVGGMASSSGNPIKPFRDAGAKYADVIHNAKEIGQGEFVSKEFFYNHTSNAYHIENRGFSNFTLGARYLYAPAGYGHSWLYGKIHDSEDTNLNYETVSTLQMGTRAILISTRKQMFSVADPMHTTRSQQYFWKKTSKPLITDSDGQANCLHGTVPYPYYHYGNIVRENDNQYGGNSLESIQKTRWVNAGNFHPLNIDDQHHHTTVLGGDTFVALYSHQITTSPYPEKSYSKWVVFPCESFVNTEMRSGYHLAAGDHIEGFDQDNPPFSNDWFYNEVYSQENNLKSYLSLQDTDQQYTDLPVEIAYSKTKLSGEQTDAFRVFPIFNFYDVEAIYGQINRIINFQNEIHFFQENAFGQLLVNPRTFLQDTSGVESIFTGSGDTIESHQYISIKYGTKHMHSVVPSERNLFFFDIRFAKLLKYGSDKKLVSISDDLGTRDLFEKAIQYGRLKSEQKFYDAIRVNMCDMPLYHVGIHGAFDYSSNSLYMTFSDRLRFDAADTVNNNQGTYFDDSGVRDPFSNAIVNAADTTITSTTIRYNEDIDAVISRYSVYPQQWIEHDGSLFTPQSRLPWMSYEDIDGISLINGFRHIDDNNFGRFAAGVYGLSDRHNMSAYHYTTHELSAGPLRLWKWEGSEECTRFFGDERLHQDLNITPFVESDFYTEDSYPLYMTETDSDGNIIYDTATQDDLARRIVHKSYIEKIITDAPGENKKFDNLNIVTSVRSINNTSNNVLAYVTNPDLTSTTIRRDQENFNASMYFEDLHFESDSFPRTRIDIRTNNTPGFPSTINFEDTLHKYREGILRVPLRNRNATQRVVGTYLSANLSARTTEKFNIFAIMAKYRKSYS
tara:strand:- start:8744 stop:14533 length:5790 start_codon:yes stop_codon:yes gene_type:complete